MAVNDRALEVEDKREIKQLVHDHALVVARRILQRRYDHYIAALRKLDEVAILDSSVAAPILFKMKECRAILDLISE